MDTIRLPQQMQTEALAIRQSGRRIGFVPTMGALHKGHLSLIREARKHSDIVVVSIYVNPTQFGPNEDFSRYPRPISSDKALLEKEGVDFLFNPENLYDEDASTTVSESSASADREGASRPGHFDGVTTVVAKLFNIVLPDIAVFGQKDAQQCDVIERMVRDLHFPVKIIRGPIIRDQRGLAMSSRNEYLGCHEYGLALALPQTLQEAARKYKNGELEVPPAEWAREQLNQAEGIEVQYVEEYQGEHSCFLCAAIYVGKEARTEFDEGRVRLIDNVQLDQINQPSPSSG